VDPGSQLTHAKIPGGLDVKEQYFVGDVPAVEAVVLFSMLLWATLCYWLMINKDS